jgi:hypothetical protein
MTPSVVFGWVDASSIGESCPIPPHEIVHAACHRRLGVSGWVCRRSRRDTNRRRALLRAVPECGQVGLVKPEASPFQAGHARERVRASVIGFRDWWYSMDQVGPPGQSRRVLLSGPLISMPPMFREATRAQNQTSPIP